MWTDDRTLSDPRRALQLGLGFASPLWPTFAVAASAGVAFWAWNQWARGRAVSEFVGALTIPELDAAAPPAASPKTPAAERPEEIVAANDPPAELEAASAPEAAPPIAEPVAAAAAVVEEPVAEVLEETLAVAPSEPERAPTKPKGGRRRSSSIPLVAAPAPEAVIEAAAPKPSTPKRAVKSIGKSAGRKAGVAPASVRARRKAAKKV